MWGLLKKYRVRRRLRGHFYQNHEAVPPARQAFHSISDRWREISRNASAMRAHFLRSSFCFSVISLLMFSIFGFFTSFSHFLYSLYQKFWTFSNERAEGREAARKISSALPSARRMPALFEISLENSIRFQIFEGNHSKFSRISNNISRFQIFE